MGLLQLGVAIKIEAGPAKQQGCVSAGKPWASEQPIRLGQQERPDRTAFFSVGFESYLFHEQ